MNQPLAVFVIIIMIGIVALPIVVGWYATRTMDRE